MPEQAGNRTGNGETKMVIAGGDTYIYLAEREQWDKVAGRVATAA